MTADAHHPIRRQTETRHRKQTDRCRECLRQIHPLTHEQQLALIEEARAARRAHPKDTGSQSHWS